MSLTSFPLQAEQRLFRAASSLASTKRIDRRTRAQRLEEVRSLTRRFVIAAGFVACTAYLVFALST